MSPTPSFGIIADIQYADCADGLSFRGNPRYYRQALHSTQTAVGTFCKEQVAAAINLGDTVDAKSAKTGSSNALDQVLSVFDKGPCTHHVVGNHELSVVQNDRHELHRRMKVPFVREGHDLVGYYSITPVPGIRWIVLDPYDICLQRPDCSPKYQQAVELLHQRNPNPNKKSPEGLVGVARRYVSMGGALGETQLQWLRHQLETARHNHERVLVACHQPLHPESVAQADLPASLVWNYPQVLHLLEDYADVVALCVSGHAHRSGYARSKAGIHYRLIEAALEHRESTFAILDVLADRIVLRGFGGCPSESYALDHLSKL